MVTCERCCDAHSAYLGQEALRSRNTTTIRPLPSATITISDIRRQEIKGNFTQPGRNTIISGEDNLNGYDGVRLLAATPSASQPMVQSSPYYQPIVSRQLYETPRNIAWTGNSSEWGVPMPQWQPYSQVPYSQPMSRVFVQSNTVPTQPPTLPQIPLHGIQPSTVARQATSPIIAASQPPLSIEAPPQLSPLPSQVTRESTAQSSTHTSSTLREQNPVAVILSQATKPGIPAALRESLYQ